MIAAGCSGATDEEETIPAPAAPVAPAPRAGGGWSSHADTVCADYNARLQALPQPITAAGTPLLLARKGDLTRSTAQQLDSLPSPPAAARLLLAALERRAIALDELADAESEQDDRRAQLAIRTGRAADRAADRWSVRLGAKACGRELFGRRD